MLGVVFPDAAGQVSADVSSIQSRLMHLLSLFWMLSIRLDLIQNKMGAPEPDHHPEELSRSMIYLFPKLSTLKEPI